MAKKFNWKNKSLWKKIGIGAVVGVLGIGAIMGVGALLDKSEDTTTKTINPSYAVGGLTEQGAYLETESSIYTKDSFQCDGLDIDLAFNNNVSYRIFFYDEDNDFIESTEKQTGNYNTEDNLMPIGTEYARIVITPNNDKEIKWYEINGYADQLEIEVAKDQDSGINVKQLVNLFEIDEEHIGSFVGADSSGNIAWSTNEKFGATTPIDCSNIQQLEFRYSEDNLSTALTYWFFDDELKKVDNGTTPAGQTSIIVEVPDGATQLIVNYSLGSEFAIYKVA